MRINRFIAQGSALSRRAADQAIQEGRVMLNGAPAMLSADVSEHDVITLDGKPLQPPSATRTILLHKPVGYVVSRSGQGSRTIYDLLPQELESLKPVGRLDKDSSGLLLLTSDGLLAHELTHPRFLKTKVYEVELDRPLQPLHRQMISEHGITLEDGPSKLTLERLHDHGDTAWRVIMHEGRNRQIRRTFAAVGYTVTKLHRVQFGPYRLPDDLANGSYRDI